MNIRKLFALIVAILAILANACTPKPFLKVQYQLPPSSTALTGESISLKISDHRKDATFLTSGAKKSIKNFNDTYSLVVLRADGSGNLIGAYDLNSLLREIFKQRLENEGVQVTADAAEARGRLEIQLKKFKLDIVDRKWTLHMSYHAGLSGNQGVLAEESVNGSAERLKVMGKRDAEIILGELVTDVVNKLDVATLIEKIR